MDDATFDKIARDELSYIEEQLMDVDPDDVEVTSSDGVLKLDLRDGVRVVINSHRAARQIWMAAVANAWKFDLDERDGRWRLPGDSTVELRATIRSVVKQRIAVELPL
ncbi:MAG: iron donor protein CyaY [Myxococcota bacterium]